ncbi:MAG TPA: alpha-amylase family glycosyl hydrolase [Mariprofundaceae bacterium]|nr:alpha-amylase family glycosyl hydrolase [Mariprofundaceae bacterium]
MATSIYAPEVQTELDSPRLAVPGKTLTPSPDDWRDQWIYFLMVDRFNNPTSPPSSMPAIPYDAKYGGFQGGTVAGIRHKLSYLKDLGVGAIWFTPVLKNCQFLDGRTDDGSYHGYGIQDFLHLDPRLFSDAAKADEELQALIDDAHAHGIYIVFDIVLNHAGDVFAYASGSEADHSDAPQTVHWRDADGYPRADWPVAEDIPNPPPDAAVFPDELRRNAFFRRQGKPEHNGPETIGDFSSLKQMLTADHQLGNDLIRIFQYLIARYDIDGFRIDTLKFLDREFALRFGNAIREFALSVGKKNFFTYGEVYDNEWKISEYIGRNVSASGDLVGVDASLDFPLFFRLPGMLKGLLPPSSVVGMYQARKQIERDVISSHGEATRFFVTFLDNHDQKQRFYFSPQGDPHRYDDQATMAFACLFSLPGIPCIYYGSEQGLHGIGDSDQNVREALWGKPHAFDRQHPFYRAIRRTARIRREQPALRYGRFYFRPISGDGFHFGISTFNGGVLAFSRILNDQEIVVVVNTNDQSGFSGAVIIDASLNPAGAGFEILFSNKKKPVKPSPAVRIAAAEIHEVDGGVSGGPATVLAVSLAAMEIQILGRPIG